MTQEPEVAKISDGMNVSIPSPPKILPSELPLNDRQKLIALRYHGDPQRDRYAAFFYASEDLNTEEIDESYQPTLDKMQWIPIALIEADFLPNVLRLPQEEVGFYVSMIVDTPLDMSPVLLLTHHGLAFGRMTLVEEQLRLVKGGEA